MLETAPPQKRKSTTARNDAKPATSGTLASMLASHDGALSLMRPTHVPLPLVADARVRQSAMISRRLQSPAFCTKRQGAMRCMVALTTPPCCPAALLPRCPAAWRSAALLPWPIGCLAFNHLAVPPSCYPVAPPSSCLAFNRLVVLTSCCPAVRPLRCSCYPDALLRAYCLIASMAEIFVALRAG